MPVTPIPAGTTWTDVEGRTWTTHGELFLKDTPPFGSWVSIRTIVADLLRTAIAAEVNVYDYPPDNLKVPAVVVQPTSPYWEPSDMGGPDKIVWGMELLLMFSRTKTDESLNRLELLANDILVTLPEFPIHERILQIAWADFGDLGTREGGGAEYLTGTITMGVVAKLESV